MLNQKHIIIIIIFQREEKPRVQGHTSSVDLQTKNKFLFLFYVCYLLQLDHHQAILRKRMDEALTLLSLFNAKLSPSHVFTFFLQYACDICFYSIPFLFTFQHTLNWTFTIYEVHPVSKFRLYFLPWQRCNYSSVHAQQLLRVKEKEMTPF